MSASWGDQCLGSEASLGHPTEQQEEAVEWILPQSKDWRVGVDPRSGGPGLLWLCLSAHALPWRFLSLLTLSLRPFQTAASPTGPASSLLSPEREAPEGVAMPPVTFSPATANLWLPGGPALTQSVVARAPREWAV